MSYLVRHAAAAACSHLIAPLRRQTVDRLDVDSLALLALARQDGRARARRESSRVDAKAG